MNKIKEKGTALLRKLEKYTKTDMVYLAHGGFWLTVSNGIVSFSSFLLAIAFAHFVSKETYGQYKYILSLASILGTLTLTGLGSALLRSVSQGYEGTLQYAFWKNLKWSGLFFLSSLIISIYYFFHDNTTLGISLLFIGSLSPILQSTNLYSPFLTAKKDFRRSAIYFDIFGNIFPFFSLFVTMLFTDNPLYLVIVYFISNTLIGLILYLRVLKIYKPNKKIDNELIVYSKHLSFLNIISGVANNIDQVLIFHYIGAIELAVYNFAIAIPNQTKGPLKGLMNLMFPKFVERSDDEIRSGMKNKFFLLLLTGFFMAGFLIVILPYAFHIFFPKYSESIIYSQIFSLSLLSIIGSPADTYLSAKKKIKEQYIGTLIMSIIQILVVSISIILWGLIGLIVARVIVRLINSIVSISLYRYAIRTSTSQ